MTTHEQRYAIPTNKFSTFLCSITLIRSENSSLSDDMAFKDKVDVIDLIISVLREHESSLDRLVERLEKLNEHLEGSMEEAPLYDEKDRDESADLLNYKVQELERRLEKYRGMLKTILDHCERIQDIACVREIADKALEI